MQPIHLPQLFEVFRSDRLQICNIFDKFIEIPSSKCVLSTFSINDEDQDIDSTYGVKFIIFEKCMLIFSTNRPYSINHIFKNLLKYRPVGDSTELDEDLAPKDL